MTPNTIETIQFLYFSPTGTTRRTVEAIAEGTGLRIADPINLTLPAPREGWNGCARATLFIVI